MKNILVVKRLNIFTILIVIICKIFKFEVHFFEFSKKISNWGLVKFLSLHKCNFEECIFVLTLLSSYIYITAIDMPIKNTCIFYY